MTQELPLVSVITPSFNQGKYIEETIKSILAQDYPRIEYIVVDGASTDKTLAILERYEGRLHLISKPDRGQTEALNKGFRLARGEIVCWVNADDLLLPGAISTAVASFSENPDCMLVYGDGHLIDEAGTFLSRFPYARPFDLWKLMRIESFILQPTTFFRKCALEEIGYLDESYNWCMDWDLWIRLGSRFPVRYIPQPFASARLHRQTKTSNGGIARLREIKRVLSRFGNRKYLLAMSRITFGHVRTTLFLRFLKQGKSLCQPDSMTKKSLRLLFDNQGLYDDGALGKRAKLMFPLGVDADLVQLDLETPREAGMQAVTCYSNRIRLFSCDLPAGAATVSIPYNRLLEHPTEVELHFRATFGHGVVWRRRSSFLVGTRLVKS
ncbi:glycosyltransferase family 2 protein [Geobacter sp. DSM 9736]|uniref:glycosyltransferase family 2 protein n=1 Tax=Geobacter sp. DSM 9736 TaxID=1277350 RepID=UPI000B511DFB|nr:glycosyltransferase family 2 protein [Geobacter sp. DSM 9736]SNB46610.1 Glycosyl transferase family 2 [Geobacter sp. DSM 9736]